MRLVARLQPAIDAFNFALTDLWLQQGTVTPADVRRLLGPLLDAIEKELGEFAVIGREETAQLIERSLGLGLDYAPKLANLGTLQNVFESQFVRADPAALKALMDIASSEAFRDAWAQFGANAAQNLLDVLMAGVATGMNPRDIARIISNWFGIPYSWAENMARTAQIWGYRLGNHAAFQANRDIIEGWYWHSALNARTCISCWDQHGSFHTVDEILNDHHQGRCTPVPKIKGVPLSMPMGSEAFNKLSPAQQREIMGPGMYDAYKRGDVGWGDFSREYHNDTYGTMLRAATLTELGVR